MRQIVQNLRSGDMELMDVPCPKPARGHVLVQTRSSLISAGTERWVVEFGKASLIAKARQNPERVKQVLAKIKADGLLPTLDAVFSRLDEPLPMGYCNAGVVVDVGPRVSGFSIGDRVASNGWHGELVTVPTNLCAKIPDQVDDDEACFAVLGAIALQGIRLLQPQLSETVVVFGLGLVGLLTVQMLAASGARVIGIDLDADRLRLAESAGATTLNPGQGIDVIAAVHSRTNGHGADGVLITASAKNDSIASQAAQMTRKRGRVILVGVVDLELNRSEFYEKELSFQVSCSYGPGRYDPFYEQQGHDYPYPFVRWTEQRNIQAVVDLMQTGDLKPASLVSHRIDFDDAIEAYELLSSGRSQLGIVLSYPRGEISIEREVSFEVPKVQTYSPGGRPVVAMIGAGAFTKGVLLPALAKTDAVLQTIVSAGGVSASHAARKFGFKHASTDYQTVLADDNINTVFITTRHNLHASMVVEALNAGKHVFVEKPLSLDAEGLEQVADAFERSSDQHLMVGFNRRFAPFIVRAKELVCHRTGPLCMTMLVNAGAIPPDHWIHDPQVGGGRIIGEGCHWIDLLTFLAGSSIASAHADHVGKAASVATSGDHCSISLKFDDGSLGTVHYFSNGHRSFPKERLTLFVDGKTLEMDNYRTLKGFGFGGFRSTKSMRQDKGHVDECRQFVTRVAEGGEPLIPFRQLHQVTEVSHRCAGFLGTGRPETVGV